MSKVNQGLDTGLNQAEKLAKEYNFWQYHIIGNY
jgi:hypothetical protein